MQHSQSGTQSNPAGTPFKRSGIPAPLQSHGVKRVYPRDSVRLFKSDFLEQFTHVNPVVPLIVWVPVFAILLYRAFAVHGLSFGEVALYGFLGLAFWSLIEYVLHRFVFHYPAKSKLGNRLVYMLHGLHHEDPQDPTRLVMPVVPAMAYALILFPLFRIFLGPVYVETFIAFFLVGYLAYDYIHFYVHHFVPKYALGKFLKRYHMEHHFADYEAKWGVSNPFWDYVFGTVESKHTRNSSGTQRTSLR